MLSVVPAHIQDQILDLLGIKLTPLSSSYGSVALPFHQIESHVPVEPPGSTHGPAKDDCVEGEESGVDVSILVEQVYSAGDVRCAGPDQSLTQVSSSPGVCADRDGVSCKGVRLGEMAGGTAEHGADLCCGRHFGL